jgi:hypothetical protein
MPGVKVECIQLVISIGRGETVAGGLRAASAARQSLESAAHSGLPIGDNRCGSHCDASIMDA